MAQGFSFGWTVSLVTYLHIPYVLVITFATYSNFYGCVDMELHRPVIRRNRIP